MIDLHCHILPGVDDGARSLADAIAMCRMAADQGCEAMVATPHQRRDPWWNDDCDRLRALAGELQEAVGAGFRVLLGGEVHVDGGVLGEMERLPGSGILPLAGSRYVLLEFAPYGSPDEAVHLIHEMSVAGWRPIVAHPEFVSWLAADLGLAGHLVSLGATLQVTAMSVTGDFGRRPMLDTHSLLAAGLVHFVASDAHDTARRPPGLRRACEMIAGRWGQEMAQRLTSDNPRAVIEDRPLLEGEA